jgi:ATP-binding cassette subfamily B protein
MSLQGDLSNVIPILGTFAVGAQRLLPSLQQVYSSVTSINSSYYSFNDVLALLEDPLPTHAKYSKRVPMVFKKEIKLNNISFKYFKGGPYILKSVNLAFCYGECVGIIGKSGSGKTTLSDVIMGLLFPTGGELMVDGKVVTKSNFRSWQANISHIP